MATKIVQLEDDTFVEVEISPDQAQQISYGKKLNTSFEKIQPVLMKVCRPINAVWQEISQEMHIEQAEIELGLSFEGEGNIFVTKAKAGANLTIKLTLKPKK